MGKLFSRGIILEQHKEPALSREIKNFAAGSAQYISGSFPVNIDEISAEEIAGIARDAGIIDERDGKALHLKLARRSNKNATAIVVDAIDDEPFVSSQLSPMLKYRSELALGALFAQKAVGAQRKYIGVYKNISDIEIKIPKDIDGIPIKRIMGRYPVDFRLADEFKGEKIVPIGACALIHLARAATAGQKHTSVFVTVSGNCVTPTNVEVEVGTPVIKVLEACGLADDPNHLVMGGPMTGDCITDIDKAVIEYSTRAILAIKDDYMERNYSCIGCAKCSDVCPEGLNPYYIYHSIKHKRYFDLKLYKTDRCIGCGTCSYVCPAKLEISATIQNAKKYLMAKSQGAVR